jgi:hypothetical protein
MRVNSYVAVSLAVLLAAVVGCKGQGSGEGDELDQLRKKGWNTCKEEMDRRLKSPSTAEYGEPTYNEKAGEIVVTFEVDAQNSFGAMVRSKHRCVARLKRGDMSVVKLEKIER